MVDENTKRFCLPLLDNTHVLRGKFFLIEIQAGETMKKLETAGYVAEQLLSAEADRNAILVNLGGGVVCDLGGFTASVYKRGIRYVNIPTTLLAQVDAAIGGKTGLNVENVKNAIGTYAFPSWVFVCLKFLETLPVKHLLNGYAEMFKYGLIADKELWLDLKEQDPTLPPGTGLVEKSIKIKNEIVASDPREKGVRKLLNFGHTLGHAFESAGLRNDGDSTLHGEAVAAGMVCESYLSMKYAGLPEKDLQEITGFIMQRFGKLPLKHEKKDELMRFMRNDKKNSAGMIGVAMISEIGKALFDLMVTEKDVEECLDYYLKS